MVEGRIPRHILEHVKKKHNTEFILTVGDAHRIIFVCAAVFMWFQEVMEIKFAITVKITDASVLVATIVVRRCLVGQTLVVQVLREVGVLNVLRRGDARCVNVWLRSVCRCLRRRHVKLVTMR